MLSDTDTPSMQWTDLPLSWVNSFLRNNGILFPNEERAALDNEMLTYLNRDYLDELYFMEERRRPLPTGGWEYPVFQYELRYVDSFKNGEEFGGNIIAGSGNWFSLGEDWAWLEVYADGTMPGEASDEPRAKWNWLKFNCQGDWFVIVEEGPEGWEGDRNLRVYLPNDDDALRFGLTFPTA